MGIKEISQPPFELTKPETIVSIEAALNDKFNNPTAIRKDPKTGIFVLDNATQNRFNLGTQIVVYRGELGEQITFVEYFDEFTQPRKGRRKNLENEPSKLIYDYYSLDREHFILQVDSTDDHLSPLARAKLKQLKLDGVPLEATDINGLLFTPSEKHAQRVLTAIKDMKIFIE